MKGDKENTSDKSDRLIEFMLKILWALFILAALGDIVWSVFVAYSILSRT